MHHGLERIPRMAGRSLPDRGDPNQRWRPGRAAAAAARPGRRFLLGPLRPILALVQRQRYSCPSRGCAAILSRPGTSRRRSGRASARPGRRCAGVWGRSAPRSGLHGPDRGVEGAAPSHALFWVAAGRGPKKNSVLFFFLGQYVRRPLRFILAEIDYRPLGRP